jgi:hypothetical protein
MFDDVAASAPRITSDLLAKSAAPLAKLIPRNLRRVTPHSLFPAAGLFVMTRGDKVMKSIFKCKMMIRFARASGSQSRLGDFFPKP